MLVLAGCSASGQPPESTARVAVLKTRLPVHDPVWSDNDRTLLALTRGTGQIARIRPVGTDTAEPLTARTTVSEPLADVGENLATSPTGHNVVFLPQPERDRVAVIDTDSLRRVDTLRVGPAPSFVAKDSGSRALLALSEDGSTVTGGDLRDSGSVTSQRVGASPEAELDSPKRGRLVDYHVAGPGGILHYKGAPRSVRREGESTIRAEKTASDRIKASRLYVAEKGTDRLLAVDTKRTHEGMEVVARTRLGEPVHHLGVDETRIYAATESRIVVLETNSYEGYANDEFTLVDTIDYRAALSGEELGKAPLSGLAVGPERVYMTLRGQPAVVSVAKPNI